MNKNYWWGGGALAVVILLAAVFWTLSAPPITAAVLYIDNGVVEVDIGNGWVQGADEMELGEGAKVRTGKGSASVVLQEGEVMSLEPNTEVELSELSKNKISIRQVAGETWNKITKISGITSYEVETPNTVATVRGTEFFLATNVEDDLLVEEGEVDFGFIKTPSKKIGVNAKNKAKAKGQDIIEETFTTDPRAAKFKEKYIKHLRQIRMREIKKNKMLLGIAKKQYGVTDDQIQQYLIDADEGRVDIDSDYKQVPGVFKGKIERAYLITKAIRKAKSQP
jgi:hypothetical protein